eukprot:gene8490-9397_t
MDWLDNFVSDHTPHENSKLTSQKSEIVSLGVLELNENDSHDIISIIEHLQSYVPITSAGDQVATLSCGDLLTLERELHAQDDRCNSRNPKACLQGLMPCMEDFHTFGNFLAVSHAKKQSNF